MEAFALSPDAPRVPLPQRLLSDERLLRLIAAGNAQAFGAVYARYHAPLYAYCRSIVRDPDDARDALQNTMMKALAALARGSDREVALKPWLFRIAHNESISLLRRRRPSEPLTDAVSPPVAGAHAEAEARERLAQLVADLQQLPERQRSALIMREVNGLGYAEIAAALEVSEGAARQTVFEARAALAEYGEGREVACENIRRSISDGDGRALRARRVRAHLRACDGCRDFQSTLQTRRRDLAMLTPALSGGSVLALMQGVLGAGAGAGIATSVGTTAGGASLLGGTASGLFASGAAKSVVAIVAATAAGAGAIEIEHGGPHVGARPGRASARAAGAAPGPAQVQAATMIRTAGEHPTRALTPLSRSLVRTAPAAALDGRALPGRGPVHAPAGAGRGLRRGAQNVQAGLGRAGAPLAGAHDMGGQGPGGAMDHLSGRPFSGGGRGGGRSGDDLGAGRRPDDGSGGRGTNRPDDFTSDLGAGDRGGAPSGYGTVRPDVAPADGVGAGPRPDRSGGDHLGPAGGYDGGARVGGPRDGSSGAPAYAPAPPTDAAAPTRPAPSGPAPGDGTVAP